jgi:DNA (cytosine-5)-methyltransferase 1
MSYVDSAKQSSLTSISIGPGIRGIERGVDRVARLNHLAYVEIETFIIENMVAEMEACLLAPAPIWSDCKTCAWEIFRGLVDILFAGYPCQPFSTAGKRRGSEDPRHLFPHIERAVRIIRPRACFFENVRGHVSCGLPEVIASLEGLGYRVHWGIYSAEETGAAHKRERVFILAVDNTTHDRHEFWQAAYRGNTDESFTCEQQGSEVRSESQRSDSAMANANVSGLGRLNNSGIQSETFGSSELGNTAGTNEQLERINETSREKEVGGYGDDELADSNSERKSQPERNNGEGGQRTINGSESMGNANDSGLQGRISGVSKERTSERIARENGPFSRAIVSRPGQPQQAWEHPRVISRKVESTVGLSAHGYHFREDILRALGNSVYEDTAELAFRDLLRKHGIKIN